MTKADILTAALAVSVTGYIAAIGYTVYLITRRMNHK